VTVSGGTLLTFVLNPACADVISTGGTDSLIVLVRGLADVSGTPTCLTDTALAAKGTLFLPHNILAVTNPCKSEVAVLTKDHAVWLTDFIALMPWTSATGDALVPKLGNPLAVPMNIWVLAPGDSPTVAGKIKEIKNIHLDRAAGVLVDSYAGLVLGDTPTGPNVQALTDSISKRVAGYGCAGVDSIKAHSTLFDEGHLNVFYVADVTSPSSGNASIAGLTCVEEGASNIIFINANEAGPFILMHEVGHALGLVRPNAGHTNNMSGFRHTVVAGSNVGLDVMDASSEIAGKYFSVGQVLTMHIGGDSWLNLSSGPGGSTLRQRAFPGPPWVIQDGCACPENQPAEHCPALKLDVARPGTLATWSGSPQACFLEVFDQPQAPIGCSATPTPVTARYYQGHFPEVMTPAVASPATWTSLTPSIVTVTTGPFVSSGISLANLRGVPGVGGVTNGTGWIRVWTDGAHYQFPVTVSCP
jgi:hypothetical protein